jgi:hypothetical protein
MWWLGWGITGRVASSLALDMGNVPNDLDLSRDFVQFIWTIHWNADNIA